MRSALAILGETGRTDFTVLEVVERSKTSLRSFYQHFSTKDELLLALIEKIMAESTLNWREATDGLDATAALQLLIERISAPASTSTTGQHQSWPDLLQRPPRRDVAARIRQGAVPVARTHHRHHQARHRRGHVLRRGRRRHHRRADHADGARRACGCVCWAPNSTMCPSKASHIFTFCIRALAK